MGNTKGPRNQKISADIRKVLTGINPDQIFHSSDILRKVNAMRCPRQKNPVEMPTLAGLLKGMPDVRFVSKGTWQKLESQTSELEIIEAIT